MSLRFCNFSNDSEVHGHTAFHWVAHNPPKQSATTISHGFLNYFTVTPLSSHFYCPAFLAGQTSPHKSTRCLNPRALGRHLFGIRYMTNTEQVQHIM